MKRTPLNKISKQPIAKIQRKLWELCKQITRKVHGNVCYTCGKTCLDGVNWQTGHLWAKASLGAFMKYDLRVLRPQCFRCNINLGGMGAEFYSRMLKEIGQEGMSELERDRQKTVKAYDHYLKLLKDYEEILGELTCSTNI